MNGSLINMMKGAKTLVEVNAGVKESEKVLIVTDSFGIEIANALAIAIQMIGAEYTIAVMEPRKAHGENPTEAIAKAMLEVDVVFAPTKFSLSHSDARVKANEKGVRFISMPDYNEAIISGDALTVDFIGKVEIVDKLAKIFDKGNKVRITTELGTDMILDISGRAGNRVSGICREKGSWGSPPNIEVNVSPIEDKSNGVIVVDASIPLPEIGLLQSPITIEIKDGKIISFEGKNKVEELKKALDYETDPANIVLAELGIGLNDKALVCGSMLEDEGAYKTAHFGFGNNIDSGGLNSATNHIDFIIRNATIHIDEFLIIKDGELQIQSINELVSH